MAFDYPTLKLIWWMFILALLISFALSSGLGVGIAAVLPVVGRNDNERRGVINSIAPTWVGNQVWFIIAGGASFAAWPLAYSVAFSGFNAVLILAVFALFLRPVGLDWRSQIAGARRRISWDYALSIACAITALAFGLAVGNLMQGVPFQYNGLMQTSCECALLEPLNPFALLTGLLSLAMLAMYGCAYLQSKSEGAVRARALTCTRVAALATIGLFIIAGLWVATSLPGYRVARMPDAGPLITPLTKTVVRAAGAWMSNYTRHPWMWAAPAAAMLGAALTFVLRDRRASWASGVSIAGIILTAGLSMFPFVIPSSLDLPSSLTAWDAASSRQTLNVMFWAMAIFLPSLIGILMWIYPERRSRS